MRLAIGGEVHEDIIHAHRAARTVVESAFNDGFGHHGDGVVTWNFIPVAGSKGWLS